jgi:ATPase subunit of ABC transporter with duplicated ATPase domains
MVAVVGLHGSGKATFLKLLAHRLFPTAGKVFVPTHIRMVFVSQENLLLNGSIWQNLTFGSPGLTDTHLVLDVCRELGMTKVSKMMEEDPEWPPDHHIQRSDHLTNGLSSPPLSGRSDQSWAPEDPILRAKVDPRGNIDRAYKKYSDSDDSESESITHYTVEETDRESTDRESTREFGGAGSFCRTMCCKADDEEINIMGEKTWHSRVTYTDRVKISLARAFIMNPEMLVCSRPYHHFDPTSAKVIEKVLMKHHDNRGLGMDKESVFRRRPRSLFFTPETAEQASPADVIWQMTDRTVLELSQKDLIEKFASFEHGVPDADR